MADTGIFSSIPIPDPVQTWQQWENLRGAQLGNQGKEISNDSAQTALQLGKLQNLQRLLGAHLSDPHVTKTDLMDTIDRGIGRYFTPEQAFQAKQQLASVPDDPTSLHRHLMKGLSANIDAQTVLQNRVPSDGPTLTNGTTNTYTQKDPVFSDNPGTIRPVAESQQGLTPGELAGTRNVDVQVPTGRKNPDGTPVLGADGQPEKSVQNMPLTKARELGLIDPGLSQRLMNPAPPTFTPQNRLGSSPPGAVPPLGSPLGSGPNTAPYQAPNDGLPQVPFQAPPRTPGYISGQPLPPGYVRAPDGRIYVTQVPPSGQPDRRGGQPFVPQQQSPSAAPGVVQPATPDLPPANNPLARPTNQDDLVRSGTTAKTANDLKYSSDDHKNFVQGGYTALEALDHPDMRTGNGQFRISAALSALARLGVPIDKTLPNLNDQLSHSIAQMQPLSGTDAARITAGLASGSPETSIEALKGLVRANMANRLQGQYAHNVNRFTQPQDYTNAFNRTVQSIDQRVIVAHLIKDPTQRADYIKSLTSGMAGPAAVEFVKDFQKKYNALDHSALGVNSGTPAPGR